MKYFLLLTSIGCFALAIACASLNQEKEDPSPSAQTSPQSDREPGFVHK